MSAEQFSNSWIIISVHMNTIIKGEECHAIRRGEPLRTQRMLVLVKSILIMSSP